MGYSVSAVTASGAVNMRSGSVAEIRATISEARRDGAASVSLTRDGKAISEGDLAKLTATLLNSRIA